MAEHAPTLAQCQVLEVKCAQILGDLDDRRTKLLDWGHSGMSEARHAKTIEVITAAMSDIADVKAGVVLGD